jgi:DNA-binding transcriptional LysR family regulator
MEMHQVRYFLAVCDTLNFRRAADQCHVTPPALTRAIQGLEAELGGLLFRRERSLTHVTDFGRLIRPHLERMMADAEAAKLTARGFLKLENAPINLGVMCSVGPSRFMSFLGAFRQANPGIELTLIEGMPSQLGDLLLDGQLDLAVMAAPGGFNERLEAKPLYRERFCIAFPAGHAFEAHATVTVDDAITEPHLLRIHCEYNAHWDAEIAAKGQALQVAFRSEREDWIQTMIAAGFGTSFLPEFSPTIPGVVLRPLVEPETVREISLVSIAGRRFSPAVATFVRSCQAYAWPPGRSDGQ